MKIAVLTQYYPPEIGAPQRRLQELSRYFRSLGHDVTIITTFPSYPHGRLIGDHSQIFYKKEYIEDVKVIRTYSYFCESPSKYARLFSQLSFSFTSLFYLLTFKKTDVLLVESPPLFLGITAFLVSRIRRIPFVFHVADLWPESIKELGAIKNKSILDILYAIERFIYKKANGIIGVTKGIYNYISDAGFEKKTSFIPNGVESDRIFPFNKRSEYFKKKFHISDDDFVMLYAGTFGMSHPLNRLIDVFERLKDLENIKLIMVGNGPRFDDIKNMSEKYDGILVADAIEHEQMNELLSISDMVVLALESLKLFRGALPSKVYEANSAGKPVFCLLEGEIEDYLRKSKAGKSFGFEDVDAMAESIRYYYYNRGELEKMGKHARDYILKNYDRKIIGDEYLILFERIKKKW